MRNNIRVILFTIVSTIMLFGCNEDDPTKDYAASIRNKTWWGTLTNTGEAAQYYSVHFDTDGGLVWSQLSGDYGGKWVVEKNKVTLTFSAINVIVTGEISENDTLMNITTNTLNKVNSGKLGPNPMTVWENTLWKGMLWASNEPGFSYKIKFLQILFTPNLKYSISMPALGASDFSYEQSPSGGFFRIKKLESFHPEFFGILVSDREIKGNTSDLFTFQLIKQ